MNCSHCGKPAEARELKTYAGRCEDCATESLTKLVGSRSPLASSYNLSGKGKRQKGDGGRWEGMQYDSRATR
jgi:DNA-directed RNA polymerase subunit RPC12/RpoP